jgi:hypothetical protein
MEQLIKTLPAILQAAGDSDEVREAACKAAWKAASGEVLSDNTVPIRLSGRRLTIAVADQIWQRQLQPMLGQMLFRMNSILGQPLVGHIELRIDPETVTMARERKERPTKRSGEGDNSIPFELLSSAAGIKDTTLRNAFLNAATSSLKRVESKSKTGNQ